MPLPGPLLVALELYRFVSTGILLVPLSFAQSFLDPLTLRHSLVSIEAKASTVCRDALIGELKDRIHFIEKFTIVTG